MINATAASGTPDLLALARRLDQIGQQPPTTWDNMDEHVSFTFTKPHFLGSTAINPDEAAARMQAGDKVHLQEARTIRVNTEGGPKVVETDTIEYPKPFAEGLAELVAVNDKATPPSSPEVDIARKLNDLKHKAAGASHFYDVQSIQYQRAKYSGRLLPTYMRECDVDLARELLKGQPVDVQKVDVSSVWHNKYGTHRNTQGMEHWTITSPAQLDELLKKL